uniref:Uncharacterized protein n=1 Tax=viral metagenome TaxID=1070528 RepID=A0A6C0HLP2_9ZZZZ
MIKSKSICKSIGKSIVKRSARTKKANVCKTIKGGGLRIFDSVVKISLFDLIPHIHFLYIKYMQNYIINSAIKLKSWNDLKKDLNIIFTLNNKKNTQNTTTFFINNNSYNFLNAIQEAEVNPIIDKFNMNYDTVYFTHKYYVSLQYKTILETLAVGINNFIKHWYHVLFTQPKSSNFPKSYNVLKKYVKNNNYIKIDLKKNDQNQYQENKAITITNNRNSETQIYNDNINFKDLYIKGIFDFLYKLYNNNNKNWNKLFKIAGSSFNNLLINYRTKNTNNNNNIESTNYTNNIQIFPQLENVSVDNIEIDPKSLEDAKIMLATLFTYYIFHIDNAYKSTEYNKLLEYLKNMETIIKDSMVYKNTHTL